MNNLYEAYEVVPESHEEVYVIVWKAPPRYDFEITTECYTVDDLMLYVRAHCREDIKIISVNGMPIVNVETVEVVS